MVLLFLCNFVLILGSLANAATTNRSVEGTACVVRYVNEKGNSVSEKYQCPQYHDSPDQTLCCDRPSEMCCISPQKPPKFYELPQQTAILIATLVVLGAVILTAVMITCCCWERCPLYMACRAEAKPDYIAQPGDVAGMSLMPDDNVENVKVYEPGKASSKGNF